MRPFKLLGFRIEITYLKILNFLDITFNLINCTFKPFSKDNQTPTYIIVKFNPSRLIIIHIPNAVNIRINRLSSKKKKTSMIIR